ncbi:hypothetical protein GUJ93_ZPchr0001g29315 [Zizania palustris]|uniref:Late embryogenesis abundant protein LEA-2 subgroup domain-containing protein n=1 Tax=Zizania palustris TaxID=103762 RepID=A0A8J5SBI3_ZIZPA|nr:hypothetical protein GUJ93_ZPchr0001g29315 [Zizania palustris]
MGKQPAASQAGGGGGGEARSRARGASGTAPSTTTLGAAARHRDESVHGVRHAVAPRDGGADTSAAVQGAPLDQHIRFVSHGKEVQFGGERGPSEQSPVHGDAGKEAPERTPQRKPSYVPAWKRKEWLEQTSHAALPWPAANDRPPIPALPAVLPEERQATPVELRRLRWPKLTSQKTIERTSTLRDDDGGAFQGQPPIPAPPAVLPEERQATPVEPRRPRWPKLTSQKTIERTSTLRDDDGDAFQGQPPISAPPAVLPEERKATPVEPRRPRWPKLTSQKTIERTSTLRDDDGGAFQGQLPIPASPAVLPEEWQATPVEPRRPRWPKLTNQKTIEHTSTLRDDDGGAFQGQPPAGGSRIVAQPPQHPPTSPLNAPYYAPPAPRKSPMVLDPKQKKVQPMAICFTACCILFWLLVIAVGVAVLVVFLLYHPKSPRLRVTSATLNAGYIDELGGVGGGSSGARALNADLTVLAAIYNPNTKIHIVLRYMQLDLYFEGSMIATQAVWPAPLHEGPGGNVLRNVHLVVSEVTMTQEDVFVWHNATTKGGPVVLQLAGRFHTQLNFGHWFRYQYWVTPRCTLWLDPPPSGALRRARC